MVATPCASDNGVSSNTNSYGISAQLQSKVLYFPRPHCVAAQLSPTIARLVKGSRDQGAWWQLGAD